MAAKKKTFDKNQKKPLQEHAKKMLEAFVKGVVMKNDPKAHNWGEGGFTFFEGYSARLTEDFERARHDFTQLAAKMLNARSASENTIRTLCLKAGQEYVKKWASSDEASPPSLETAAAGLVDTVLAEAGRTFIHIEPNFLVRHSVPDVVTIGRVKSVRTDLALGAAGIKEDGRVKIVAGNYPQQIWDGERYTLEMPASVWVVDVAATKDNVTEEAKWLIDVAISLMRLGATDWPGVIPKIGEPEPHPTFPTIHNQPHVTMEGETVFMGGRKVAGWYEVTAEIAEQLSSKDFQARADVLFDPADKSLGQRVAQGLGWMTRGRQAVDRAERLLAFFTALEALLTSDDKNAPVAETISRHISVICTQNLNSRSEIFKGVKKLYGLRSSVVHAGRRDVLGSDVKKLQFYVEAVYWTVLNRCELTMKQERFAKSLADASHGQQWEFGFTADEDDETKSS
nr:HEPN domain-containing protein [uncultured Hyphomonas sp.]